MLFKCDADDDKSAAFPTTYIIVGVGAVILVIAAMVIILLVIRLRKNKNADTTLKSGNAIEILLVIHSILF